MLLRHFSFVFVAFRRFRSLLGCCVWVGAWDSLYRYVTSHVDSLPSPTWLNRKRPVQCTVYQTGTVTTGPTIRVLYCTENSSDKKDSSPTKNFLLFLIISYFFLLFLTLSYFFLHFLTSSYFFLFFLLNFSYLF